METRRHKTPTITKLPNAKVERKRRKTEDVAEHLVGRSQAPWEGKKVTKQIRYALQDGRVGQRGENKRV